MRDVTHDALAAVADVAGEVEIDPTAQETEWKTPLDEDVDHTTYEPARVAEYLRAASRAAEVLTVLRAPYRGRSTPVNAWWGSFDLAVSLFSGRAADPPGFSELRLRPAQARWDASLGEFVLDWQDVIGSADPFAAALAFARSAAQAACAACDWDPGLAASLGGRPPPVT